MSKKLIYLIVALAGLGGLGVIIYNINQPEPVKTAPKPKFDPDRFHDTTPEERSNYVQ